MEWIYKLGNLGQLVEPWRLSRRVAELATLTLIGFYASSAHAATQPGRSIVPQNCEALETIDFAGIEDAPTQIASAKLVAASGNVPETCDVSGYVAPQVHFILRLPRKAWNGKFIEVGCGGLCGVEEIQHCADPLHRGYACIATDKGHSGPGLLWANENLQAKVDFGYRATHVTALAGKALVERFYGRSARNSYFVGCSGGGLSALIEAQRFPWDFDGIIAGAPSLSVPWANLDLLWDSRAMLDASGHPILGDREFHVLHEAVIAKCDMNDGIRDRLIGDPTKCKFDPSILKCASTKTIDCLTLPQIEAVKKIYGGPVTSNGVPIHDGAAMKGSELEWGGFAGISDYVGSFLRYDVFDLGPNSHWVPSDFNFDHDYKRFGDAESLFMATDPDLRRFKAAGGKLIVYTGWSDALGLVLPVIDYYETTERTMGGRAVTQDFFRTFAVPGMAHCTGGEGAFAIDWLSYLEAWVEKGQAPFGVIGRHVNYEDLEAGLKRGDPSARLEFERRTSVPFDPRWVAFSRPIFPYPTTSRYVGVGNPNDARNFVPVDP